MKKELKQARQSIDAYREQILSSLRQRYAKLETRKENLWNIRLDDQMPQNAFKRSWMRQWLNRRISKRKYPSMSVPTTIGMKNVPTFWKWLERRIYCIKWENSRKSEKS